MYYIAIEYDTESIFKAVIPEQIMCETFNEPDIYLKSQAVLSLHASSCMTGIVMDSGAEVSQTMYIHEGNALHQTLLRLDVVERDFTEHLTKIPTERGYCKTTTVKRAMLVCNEIFKAGARHSPVCTIERCTLQVWIANQHLTVLELKEDFEIAPCYTPVCRAAFQMMCHIWILSQHLIVSDCLEIFSVGVCYTTRFVVWVTSQHPTVLVLNEHWLNIWSMKQHLMVLHSIPTDDDRTYSEHGKSTWQDQGNQN